MRDRRVDQSYELALALEGVLRQDFVGHIHEANNERRVDLVDLFVDGDLFQLELLEGWEEVALNKVNILEASEEDFDFKIFDSLDLVRPSFSYWVSL